MNILLIGGGAREHALAWRLRQSPSCDLLIAVPGNPGIAQEAECVACDVKDHAAIMAICTERSIDLVVIGPEAPLIDGLADSLRAGGIAVFGPGAKAAQLEGSKGFTKDMCAAMKIPTAAYARFDSAGSALAAVGRFGLPVVIKADGLAAGKGVIIAQTKDEANAAIRMMFDGHFGKAGAAIVIEEFLNGEEVSFFAICDGTHAIPFGAAQDHKRVGDGDTGPNTGGMGAYSPTKLFTKSIQSVVFRDIIRPTLEYMSRCGVPFTGVLFAGLMLTAEGPKLIEYNTRFGDPECQVLMMRFEGDLAALLYAAATGALASQPPVRLRDDTALTVVLAARGYPDQPQRGGLISIGDVGDARIFHAGTGFDATGALIADGGRVLSVTACATNVADAQGKAYAAVAAIDFPEGFCRSDIGSREMARKH